MVSYIFHMNYYEKRKERLKGLTVYVFRLDGKHSEKECEINFKIFTIEKILKMEYNRDEDREIDEKLFDNFCDDLGLDDIESEIIDDFSNGLLNLEKIYPIEEIKHVLSQDTIIDGINIPKGALIKYSIDNKISDDWEWEFDFNIE